MVAGLSLFNRRIQTDLLDKTNDQKYIKRHKVSDLLKLKRK